MAYIDDRGALHVYDVATRVDKTLVDQRFGVEKYVWSPDGTRIAYVSARRGGGGQLVVLHLASGRTVAVGDTGGSRHTPAWSPDGESLAIIVFRPNDKPDGVFVGDPDGGPLTRILTGQLWPGPPTAAGSPPPKPATRCARACSWWCTTPTATSRRPSTSPSARPTPGGPPAGWPSSSLPT